MSRMLSLSPLSRLTLLPLCACALTSARLVNEQPSLSLSVLSLFLPLLGGPPCLFARVCECASAGRAGKGQTLRLFARGLVGAFSLLCSRLGWGWWYTGPKPVRGHRGPAPRTTTKSVNEPEERGHRGPAPRDETCECKGPGNNHGKQSPGSPDWAPSQTYASQAVRNQGESSLV